MKVLFIDPVVRAIGEIEAKESEFRQFLGFQMLQYVHIGSGEGGVPVHLVLDEEGLLKSNQFAFSFENPHGGPVNNFVGKALVVGIHPDEGNEPIDVPMTLDQLRVPLLWRPDGWVPPAPSFRVLSLDESEAVIKSMLGEEPN